MRNAFLVLVLGCLVGGCAIGNTHRYDLGDATLGVESEQTVAVATVDMRPYVRSGDKSPNFVGLQRGGWGNPFDVRTRSGNSLADDMTVSIVESLKASNVGAVAVMVPSNAGLPAARKTLLASDADRFALFVLQEWKSDTYAATALIYDVSLSVLQSDGSVIAEEALKGRDNLGASMTPEGAREKTENGFRQKLEVLFGAPDIAKALR